MTRPVQLTVLMLVLDKPGKSSMNLSWMFGLSISLSSLCTFLKKNNFSRKKMQLVASQRDEELRAIVMSVKFQCTKIIFLFSLTRLAVTDEMLSVSMDMECEACLSNAKNYL